MEVEINFILTESPNLERDDRIEILEIVQRYDKKYIITKKDGSRINLRKLPKDAVLQIYDFMRRLLEIED